MLLTVLLALSAPGARAADGAGLTLSLGGGWFWTGSRENIENTWTLVPRVGYGPVPRWAAELEVGVLQGSTRATTSYRYDANTPRVNALFFPFPELPVQPFVAAGPGIVHKRVNRPAEVTAEEPNEQGWGNYKNPDTDLVLNAGPGLRVSLGRYVGLRGDLRYLLDIGNSSDDGRDLFSDWEATVGLTFWPFPGELDRDADGVVDSDDGCPYESDLANGIRDADGCPEASTVPEQSDDLDGDGILDADDACPTDPEDPDGFEDDDGCPEPDNDGDGILDADDTCPQEAETDNGFNDEDGCPDEAPAAFKEVSGVVRGITFHSGSSVLRPESQPVLEKIFSLLSDYPDLRVAIEGHTDDVGERAFNMELSQARSDSVRAWLEARGIEGARMTTAGLGPDEPLVPNDSEANRFENRRVELEYTNVPPEE